MGVFMKERSYIEESCISHLVERQIRSYNSQRKSIRDQETADSAGTYKFVAISHDAGSLGGMVASALAWEMGWHVFDKEIIKHIAENSHVRESIVRELDEKAKNLVHDAVERLLRMAEGTSFGEEDYHRELFKAFATLSAQGGVIFLGHGGVFALREAEGLRVRITASFAKRVKRLKKQWALPEEQVRRRLRRHDTDLNQFVRYHFGQDREHLQHYDLVFNTDNLSIDQVVASLKMMMQNTESVGLYAVE
jgi:cytidylate kinase